MTSLRQLVLSAYPEYAAASEIPDISVSGIECDSRKIENGDVFVAVRGARQDGRAFVDEAVSRGAIALILDAAPTQTYPVPVVQLPGSREAVARLARAFYGNPSAALKMIGVTGTNGKTTTTYLLEHILRSQRIATGVLGTISYRFGGREIPAVETTPGPIRLQALLSEMQTAGCQAVAMEVSSHALDQGRVEGIDFHTAVFTNLTQDHLDYHKDLESYFMAKAKLFTSLKSDGFAVINTDDEWGRRLTKMTPGRVIGYGVRDGVPASLKLPMMGDHNIYNALAAVAAAGTLGVPQEVAIQSLKDFPGVPGRLEAIRGGQDFDVLVDFAHTPDGLLNVLRSLQAYRKKKLILVFGCGGDRDRSKRPQMAEIASRLCDEVIITSDNPRSEDPKIIAQEICNGFPSSFKAYQVSLDRRKAIRQALLKARTGDIVLLAGKGHEKVQIIGTQVIPFSDQEEALKVLSGR